MEMKDWATVPRLHVLVNQLATGLHLVIPMYRGKSFFYGSDATDSEINAILIEMSRRQGVDVNECEAFGAKLNLELNTLLIDSGNESNEVTQ